MRALCGIIITLPIYLNQAFDVVSQILLATVIYENMAKLLIFANIILLSFSLS